MEKKLDVEMKDFRMDDVLGHVVNRAAIVIRKKLIMSLKEAGYPITPEEFAIIARLWEEDGLFQSEINEKTLKDKTRVTRLIKGLMDKSLIEKKVFEEDRRNFRIYLTEKGHELKYRLIPIVIQIMEISKIDISENDLEVTVKTLKKILSNVNSTLHEKESQ